LFTGPNALSEAQQSFPKWAKVRAPHHTASSASILGTLRTTEDSREHRVMTLQPGETLLAGQGILLLTDLPEFRRDILESIAEVFHAGQLWFRNNGCSISVPVAFEIVATAHSCPCGMKGREPARCSCTPGLLSRWEKRVRRGVRLFEHQGVRG
jgi:magnesium chelatase family protein